MVASASHPCSAEQLSTPTQPSSGKPSRIPGGTDSFLERLYPVFSALFVAFLEPHGELLGGRSQTHLCVPRGGLPLSVVEGRGKPRGGADPKELSPSSSFGSSLICCFQTYTWGLLSDYLSLGIFLRYLGVVTEVVPSGH